MKSFFKTAIIIFCAFGFYQNVIAQNYPNTSFNLPQGSVTNTYSPLPDYNPQNFTRSYKYNYIRTLIPYNEVTDPTALNENSAAFDTKMLTSYTDGNGQVIQTVDRNVGVYGKDLVTSPDHRTTVQSGKFRQTKLLPYAVNIATGKFHAACSTDFATQYATYNGYSFPNISDLGPYSQTVYMSDANTRKTTQYQPGTAYVGQERGTSTWDVGYVLPVIRRWDLNYTTYFPQMVGTYAPQTLQVLYSQTPGKASPNGTALATIDTDRIAVEYRDWDGKVVCRMDKIKGQGTGSSWAITSYIYDNYGRLVFTILPKAYQLASQLNWQLTSDIIGEHCSYSKYDDRGRLYETHRAGVIGNEYAVYDAKGRIVFTQTPNLQPQNRWVYTMYDALDRETFHGITVPAIPLSSSPPPTRENLQQYIDGYGSPVSVTNPNPNTILYYLSHEGEYPNTTFNQNDILFINYYDGYNATNNGTDYNQLSSPYDPTYFNNQLLNGAAYVAPFPAARNYGRLTGKKVRILRDNTANSYNLGSWIDQKYVYDVDGRVLQIVGTNATGGIEVLSYQYDQAGRKVIEVHYQQNPNATNKASVYITTHWLYEAGTQVLKTIRQRIDNGSWMTLALYQYDALGQLRRKQIGGSIEDQQYTYDIQGRLTGINPEYVDAVTTNGNSVTFGETIWYETGFGTLRYDNLPTGVVWRGSQGKPARAYGYQYDAGGRLLGADFNEFTPNGPSQATSWNHINHDYSVSGISYDINGNMGSMIQRGTGVVDQWGNTGPMTVDDLVYSYKDMPNSGNQNVSGLDYRSNRLEKVKDNVALTVHDAPPYFADRNAEGADYTYDSEGNLTSDLNKNIVSISYNLFDKPTEITVLDGGVSKKLTYIYDGLGNRIREVRTTVPNSYDYTDYLGQFTYSKPANGSWILASIHNAEGRVRCEQAPGTGTWGWKWDYYVRDHLGNVRTTLHAEPQPLTRYMASHELLSANLENLLWENLDDTRIPSPLPGAGNEMAAELTGAEPDKRIGASILLHVMAGDQLQVGTDYYYQDYEQQADQPVDGSAILNSLYNALAGGAGGFDGGEGGSPDLLGRLFSGEYQSVFESLRQGASDPSRPQAHLSFMAFDEEMTPLADQSAVFQVGGPDPNAWQTVGMNQPITIKNSGYVVISISNASMQSVYFDQVQVSVWQGRLLEEQHYYPHGLPLQDGNVNPLARRYLYQGKGWQTDLGLMWYDFHARQYDPQLGRFASLDPKAQFASGYIGMGNNPAAGIDPDGQFWEQLMVGGIIGAMNGAMTGLAAGHSGWDLTKDIVGGAAIGALGGAIGGWVAQGVVAGGSLGGSIGAGAVSGMIAGAAGGAGMAALNGRNVMQGAITGGFSGAIGGGANGAVGYANAKVAQKEFVAEKIKTCTANESGRQRITEEQWMFAKTDANEFNMHRGALADNIVRNRAQGLGISIGNGDNLYGRVPDNRGLAPNGLFVRKEGDMAIFELGLTVPTSYRHSDMYISPYVANQSNEYFLNTLGHEMVHQHHYSTGLLSATSSVRAFDMSESAARAWDRQYFLSKGMITDMMSVHSIMIQNGYPNHPKILDYRPF